MDSEVLTALKQARELISSPDNWCKGDFAQDKLGRSVFPVDPHACRWCAEGALGKVTVEAKSYCLTDCKIELKKTARTRNVGVWNDKHTHTELLAIFDETIERLENEHS